MAARRALARWLVRSLLRPGLSPARPLAWRRARAERSAGLLPLPKGLRRIPAGDENPGGEWLLPPGTGPESPRGAVLYLHGGGFILGSPATSRAIAARLARMTGLPVLSAQYRLAPEAPYPAALEDVQAAWRGITLGVARPVALAGDSAGGWLALALALYAAEAGLPRPTGLALFSPLLDLAGAEASADAADAMLPPGFVAEGVRAWRGSVPAADPRFDLLAGPLETLPPVFLSFDRDEALAGDARRLACATARAGVTLRLEEAAGLFHAWPLFAGLLPEANATLRSAAAMLVPARTGIGR
jgi:epsilon-lactone hydrolase